MIPATFAELRSGAFHDWVSQRALAVCNRVRAGHYAEACGMLKADVGAELAVTLALRVFAHLNETEREALRAAVERSTDLAHTAERRRMLRKGRV